MRPITSSEVAFITLLARHAGLTVTVAPGQPVWVVNEETGSIRPDYCPINKRVLIAATGSMTDDDGQVVIVSLLVTPGGRFGELDLWPVDGQPIVGLPTAERITFVPKPE